MALAILALGVGGAGGEALAQTQAGNADRADSASNADKTEKSEKAEKAEKAVALDTVVVTASKRKQTQREVAGTVSVVDGMALENRGAKDQEDLFKLTPGVQVNKGDPNQAVPTIRGIGTASSGTLLGIQQATTGFYIEEVPFTDPFGFVSGADLAPFDLKQVEVLRGPQGAMFGSASLGGAVSYSVNKPDLKHFEAAGLVAGETVKNGGWGHTVRAMLNAPLQTDVAGLRIVAFDRRDPGYITNLGTGRTEANELHQTGGRLIGSLRPTKDALVTAMVLTQRTSNDDTFAVSPDPERLSIDTHVASPRSSRFTLGNLRAEWTLPSGLELTSNTGFLDKQGQGVADGTRAFGKVGSFVGPSLHVGALPDLPLVTSLRPETRRSLAASQELRIGTTGSTGFQWLAGVFYQHTRFDAHAVNVAPGGAALWGPFGALLPEDVFATVYADARTTERAVFADTEIPLGTAWSLSLGGRYYDASLAFDAGTTFLSAPTRTIASLSESGFTPKAALKYRFGENLAYVLASKGYRFGGINANTALSPYKSDSLWNYEAGVRLLPVKGVRLDLSAFLLDWKDAQVSAVLPGTTPITGVANVGQARSTGLEASLQWQATRDLDLSATLARTNARTTAPFVSSATETTIPSGTRLPGTAKFQSTVQAGYAFAGPADTAGRASVAQSYTGARVFDLDGAARAPGFSQTDLRLSLAWGAWEAALSVDNVFDKRGINGAATTTLPHVSSFTDYYLIRPRTVGLSLRYDL
ncbi:TonB-dependent receptor [Mitsuaria sp. 7]|uniref:TonB-dependent receptor n=1 Tax=Mitsuaria sp. 7 TaxID=1658665 RepID=UPI0007DE2459|nr:TonB-dependent receptor [Mitsuaria sp. 7]ANH67080.1 hypothetical protein ABE85_04945 [Mitsuaria sp. 7]